MNTVPIGRAVASLLVLGAAALHAQEPVEEIIVTAALDQSADDLTQPVIVLNKEDLLLKAAGSIGETLSSELGMSATYFGPVAGRPVIRGQSGPRVSVLDSGVSSLDVADLSPDHAVPVEPLFADRIEVIRGPATLLYGSSAAGGVVNVVDNRIPEEHTENPLTGALELRGDSAANERTLAGRFDGSSGAIAWHVDAFRRATDDVEIPGFATADPALRPGYERRGRVVNSAGESQGHAAGASYIFDQGFVGIALSRYENDYGLPGPVAADAQENESQLNIAPGPFIELDQTRFDLRSEYAVGGVVERLRVRLGSNDYEHSEIEPTGEVATLFENDAWEARIEALHAPLGKWRGAAGLQINSRDFSALGEEAFVPPNKTQTYGLFVIEELPLEFGLVEFGARIESLKHRPSLGLPGYDEVAYSVAGGLKWDISADYDLSANLSRSERHPDTAELYANGAHLATGLFEIGLLANAGGTVKQEVSSNLDLAVHLHSAALNWKIGVFYNDISDYIFRLETNRLEEGLPVTPYRQQDAEFYGFESELNFLPGGIESPWQVRLFTDFVRGKTGGGNLPRIPPARLGTQLGYSGDRWSAGLEGIYHAEQNDVRSFATTSFTMLNASLVLRSGANGPVAWDLFLRATNLLDEDARRSSSFRAAFVPLPGASLHAGIRIGFN